MFYYLYSIKLNMRVFNSIDAHLICLITNSYTSQQKKTEKTKYI